MDWSIALPEVLARNAALETSTAQEDPHEEGHQQTQVDVARECVAKIMESGAIRFGEQDFCEVSILGRSADDDDQLTVIVRRMTPA
jgi:hypothetical protein